MQSRSTASSASSSTTASNTSFSRNRPRSSSRGLGGFGGEASSSSSRRSLGKGKGNGGVFSTPRRSSPPKFVTSTPSRRSAPDLDASVGPMTPNARRLNYQQQQQPQQAYPRRATAPNDLSNELTAELDLSDPTEFSALESSSAFGADESSRETTPMFVTPTSTTRVVRYISKQSNV